MMAGGNAVEINGGFRWRFTVGSASLRTVDIAADPAPVRSTDAGGAATRLMPSAVVVFSMIPAALSTSVPDILLAIGPLGSPPAVLVGLVILALIVLVGRIVLAVAWRLILVALAVLVVLWVLTAFGISVL